MQPVEHNFHGILHSATLIEEELKQRLAPLGVQPRQARVLVAIKDLAPVSQVSLAQACGITPASMSTMADRLLAAGYISRSQDLETRRRNSIDLTALGYAKLKLISAVWDQLDQDLYQLLGSNDAQALFDLSRKLRARLGGAPPNRASDAE